MGLLLSATGTYFGSSDDPSIYHVSRLRALAETQATTLQVRRKDTFEFLMFVRFFCTNWYPLFAYQRPSLGFAHGKLQDRLLFAAEILLKNGVNVIFLGFSVMRIPFIKTQQPIISFCEIGNTMEFCELMVRLDRWERALSVAPGVSLQYWQVWGLGDKQIILRYLAHYH